MTRHGNHARAPVVYGRYPCGQIDPLAEGHHRGSSSVIDVGGPSRSRWQSTTIDRRRLPRRGRWVRVSRVGTVEATRKHQCSHQRDSHHVGTVGTRSGSRNCFKTLQLAADLFHGVCYHVKSVAHIENFGMQCVDLTLSRVPLPSKRADGSRNDGRNHKAPGSDHGDPITLARVGLKCRRSLHQLTQPAMDGVAT